MFFLKEHPFWEGGVVWWGVNQMMIQFSKASIPPIIRSSNHPGAKWVVRYGIESILSPNQQQQPLYLSV